MDLSQHLETTVESGRIQTGSKDDFALIFHNFMILP